MRAALQAERRPSVKGEPPPVLTADNDHKLSRLAEDSEAKPLLRTGSPPGSPMGSPGSDARAVFNMVNAVLGAGVLGCHNTSASVIAHGAAADFRQSWR